MKLKSGFCLIPFENIWLALPQEASPEYKNALITLNKTARFCWLRLEQGIDKEMLLEEMLEAFDAPRDALLKDIDTFLAVLHTHNLLQEDEKNETNSTGNF